MKSDKTSDSKSSSSNDEKRQPNETVSPTSRSKEKPFSNKNIKHKW